MKDIEELINSKKKYKKAKLQKRLEGKKNTVSYVLLNDKPRVIKWFAPGLQRNMETEYSILKKGSSKLDIPILLEKDENNNVLVLNYIMGENLCDVINSEETSSDEKKRLMILLGRWFAQFHTHFKTADQYRIRGDAILRNFILTDRIYGVDFEESRFGKPVEDIATMCASILSTDPMFTNEKIQLCRTFIDSYEKSVKWGLMNVSNEIAYALLERIQWRPDDEDALRKFSERIRINGLR